MNGHESAKYSGISRSQGYEERVHARPTVVNVAKSVVSYGVFDFGIVASFAEKAT